jgi:hypothetical protein
VGTLAWHSSMMEAVGRGWVTAEWWVEVCVAVKGGSRSVARRKLVTESTWKGLNKCSICCKGCGLTSILDRPAASPSTRTWLKYTPTCFAFYLLAHSFSCSGRNRDRVSHAEDLSPLRPLAILLLNCLSKGEL